MHTDRQTRRHSTWTLTPIHIHTQNILAPANTFEFVFVWVLFSCAIAIGDFLSPRRVSPAGTRCARASYHLLKPPTTFILFPQREKTRRECVWGCMRMSEMGTMGLVGRWPGSAPFLAHANAPEALQKHSRVAV